MRCCATTEKLPGYDSVSVRESDSAALEAPDLSLAPCTDYHSGKEIA